MKMSFPNPDDILNFTLTIEPDEGMYKGGVFHFNFSVNQNFPHDPPKVKCTQKIYHPNIDLEGNVCLNILREDWKPVLNLNAVIVGMQVCRPVTTFSLDSMSDSALLSSSFSSSRMLPIPSTRRLRKTFAPTAMPSSATCARLWPGGPFVASPSSGYYDRAENITTPGGGPWLVPLHGCDEQRTEMMIGLEHEIMSYGLHGRGAQSS